MIPFSRNGSWAYVPRRNLSVSRHFDDAAAPQPQLSRPLDSFKLSIPRLLGVLGEPNPPFGHFDEKGFMRRSASFLRQPNALRRILA
jgi:hypothetical protein